MKTVHEPKKEPYSYAKIKEGTVIKVDTDLDMPKGIDFDAIMYNMVKDRKIVFDVESSISSFLNKLMVEVKDFFDLEEEEEDKFHFW